MGRTQTSFLAQFTSVFQARTGINTTWDGGQVLSNTAALPFNETLRRPGSAKSGERFELGDITMNIGIYRVVIEFESGEVPLSNLLKYWPYVRGEFDIRPSGSLVICHFSDWWSYATRRDLWEWTLTRMKSDPDRLVDIQGKQFDHWDDNQQRRLQSMNEAVDWIVDVLGVLPPKT